MNALKNLCFLVFWDKILGEMFKNECKEICNVLRIKYIELVAFLGQKKKNWEREYFAKGQSNIAYFFLQFK